MKEVKSTKNYKQFKKLIGNRKVDEKRIEKIMKSIRKVGYITSPIIVNEKMEVIDGQGRLEALERLDLPVEYIVQNGIGIDECISMNIHQTNWTTMDYIMSFASRGDEDYIRFLELKKGYPEASIHVLGTALFGIGKLHAQSVSNGNLIITEEQYSRAKERLNYAKEFIPYIRQSGYPVDILTQSIIFTSMIDGVDKNRFFEKMKNESRLLKPFHTLYECMQSIEELYNKGTHNKVYIFTEYRIMTLDNLKRGARKLNNKNSDVLSNNSVIEINSAEELKEALNKEE